MKYTIIASLILLMAAACKKDKKAVDPPPVKTPAVVVNPMADIDALDPENGTSDGSPGAYQVGVRFITYKEGIISRLGLRSPSAGNYRVQLYTFVANDSTTLNFPLITEPERLGYVDITIDATAAQKGTTVWANIQSVKIKPWNADGAGKVRQYGVCYNDQDLKQYQHILPAGLTFPLMFSNNLSVFKYDFFKVDNHNSYPWQNGRGGFSTLVYGGEQFEFVTTK
ncbi:hypothetical protein [Niabella drilacis]|uniref:Uncharacterized protein n=1 Tax=Niabella drilacis (strain DSM 25811 / CCM 8410 / CCUG 62505 / LMG 26954 / E90) TaxID=1285928 RepID=A0A1G6Z4K2_NIADE|nr:hypothetical protein [Niabella drilacis]SDD96887.1 hypothetical protein SAMN04487894_11733 [Niabella drilacis]